MILHLLAPGLGMGGGLTAPPPVVEFRWAELARALFLQQPARGRAWQELARVLSRVPGMTAAIQRPGEVRTYTLDLSALDEIAGGDLIASVGSASQSQWPTPAPGVPASSPLSLGAPVAALSNKGVAIQVSGPAASGGYEVRVPVTTQSGAVLFAVLLLNFTWRPYGSLET